MFHSAIGIEEEMVVIGGRDTLGRYAMDLLVYRYNCNTWHRIQFAGEKTVLVSSNIDCFTHIQFVFSFII